MGTPRIRQSDRFSRARAPRIRPSDRFFAKRRRARASSPAPLRNDPELDEVHPLLCEMTSSLTKSTAFFADGVPRFKECARFFAKRRRARGSSPALLRNGAELDEVHPLFCEMASSSRKFTRSFAQWPRARGRAPGRYETVLLRFVVDRGIQKSTPSFSRNFRASAHACPPSAQARSKRRTARHSSFTNPLEPVAWNAPSR
jgi:hypothetical protein